MCMSDTNPTGKWSDGRGLPGSNSVWLGGIVGVFFLLLGSVTTGAIAGVFGVWGVTALVATVLGYAAYRLWYRYGA